MKGSKIGHPLQTRRKKLMWGVQRHLMFFWENDSIIRIVIKSLFNLFLKKKGMKTLGIFLQYCRFCQFIGCVNSFAGSALPLAAVNFFVKNTNFLLPKCHFPKHFNYLTA